MKADELRQKTASVVRETKSYKTIIGRCEYEAKNGRYSANLEAIPHTAIIKTLEEDGFQVTKNADGGCRVSW